MSSGWTGCGGLGMWCGSRRMCATGWRETTWSARRAADAHGPARGSASKWVIADPARVTQFQIMPHGRGRRMPSMVCIPITPATAVKHQRPGHAIDIKSWRTVIVGIPRVSEVWLPIGRRVARRRGARWRISRIGIGARRWRHDAAAQSQQKGRDRETMMHRASPVRKINSRLEGHRHRSRPYQGKLRATTGRRPTSQQPTEDTARPKIMMGVRRSPRTAQVRREVTPGTR